MVAGRVASEGVVPDAAGDVLDAGDATHHGRGHAARQVDRHRAGPPGEVQPIAAAAAIDAVDTSAWAHPERVRPRAAHETLDSSEGHIVHPTGPCASDAPDVVQV